MGLPPLPNGLYTRRFYVACILFLLLSGMNMVLILKGVASGLAPFSEISGAVIALLGVNRLRWPPTKPPAKKPITKPPVPTGPTGAAPP